MDEDLDETVHLILMDDPCTPMTRGWQIARAIHPYLDFAGFAQVWIMYRGCDRIPPTKEI